MRRIHSLCLLLIASPNAFALGLDVQYPNPQYPVGERPRASAVGDFNSDGRLDVAVANQGNGMVSVLLGRGNTRLWPSVNYTVVDGPVDIAVGDFNNDQILDLVTASVTLVNAGDSPQSSFAPRKWVASILIGNGDGTFQPLVRIPFGTFVPWDDGDLFEGTIFVRDFNGDGDDDIAIARTTNDSGDFGDVRVRLGSGAIGFGSIRTTDTGKIPGVDIADIDDDGIPDLVYADDDGLVVAAIGNGAGTFGGASDFAQDVFGSSVAIGLVDGDAIPDVVTVRAATNVVRVFSGDGLGGFTAANTFNVTPRAGEFDTVVLGNFNADGFLDIALQNAFDGFELESIQLLLGSGDGTFGAGTDYLLNGSQLTTADFNGDNVDDLVSITESLAESASVAVTLGRSNGNLRTPPAYTANLRLYGVGIGDVTNDGIPDVITSSTDASELSVFPGRGNGRFRPRTVYTGGPSGLSSWVFVEDFNADSRPDVAYITEGSQFGSNGRISIRKSFPNGRLGVAQELQINGELVQAAVADFNEDGRPDIVVASNERDDRFEAQGVYVAIVGTFGGLPGYFDIDLPFADGVATGDFNGDDNADVVSAEDGSQNVRCMAGDGTGGFAPAVVTSAEASSNVGLLATGDFDNNGTEDLATLIKAGSIKLLLGDGDCTFTPGVEFDVPSAGLGILKSADINGDGFPDLVTGSRTTNAVTIHFGKGDGTFRPGRDHAVGGFPYSFGIGDVNGDGAPEIAVGLQDEVSVLIHK